MGFDLSNPRNDTRLVWLVVFVALLCYANSLLNDFCYDSVAIVQENPIVNESGQWVELWAKDHWYRSENDVAKRDLLYRPVALLTYKLTRNIFGPEAWPQHLMNIVLHAVVCSLVVLFARRIDLTAIAALLSGLLFAVLPIHTEVVNDIVGRADLLATLGILLTLLVHRRYVIERDVKKRLRWMAAGVLSAFMAMGAKESGISVILLVVLFDLYLSRQASQIPLIFVKHLSLAIKRCVYLLGPTAIYFSLRFLAFDGKLFQTPTVSKTVNVLVDASHWHHFLGTCQLVGMYVYKTFWPSVLCVDYSVNTIHLANSPIEPTVLLGIVTILTLSIASYASWKKGQLLVPFFALALLVSYLPTSNVFVLIQVFFAERIAYLPSVWGVLLIVMALVKVVPRRAIGIIAVIVFAAMVTRCWVRNSEWKDNATVAESAFRDHPTSILTLEMYGNHLSSQGRHDEGIELLKRAIAIDPGFTVAQRAIAEAYLRAGNLRNSLNHWQIADLQFPGHAQTQRAISFLRDSLANQVSPELGALRNSADDPSSSLHEEMAYVRKLLALAQYDESLARFREREDIFKNDPTWQRQYAETLLFAGKKDEAVERYRRCAVIDPEFIPAKIELAALLMERQIPGDLGEAQRLCDSAILLAPEEPTPRVLQAELFALQGRVKEAITAYRAALGIVPFDHPQRATWQARLTTLGG